MLPSAHTNGTALGKTIVLYMVKEKYKTEQHWAKKLSSIWLKKNTRQNSIGQKKCLWCG
jgi:hypothetical protein